MLARLFRQAWLWSAYWRLYPLWDALEQVIPEIEQPPEPGMRWNVQYRLHRLVIEIRDPQLTRRQVLAPGVPPHGASEEGSMSGSHFLVLRPHQLPAPPARLGGRDSELSALDQMLAIPGHGQVTIVVSGA